MATLVPSFIEAMRHLSYLDSCFLQVARPENLLDSYCIAMVVRELYCVFLLYPVYSETGDKTEVVG